MRKVGYLAWVLILAAIAGLPLLAQATAPQPLTLPLKCSGKDCALLHGKPQTAGMRSGFVRLKPGESVGWHSTGKYEETLVILSGQGKALVKGGEGMDFAAPHLVYYPPETRHNVTNTGDRVLEYVYIVAPAAAQ